MKKILAIILMSAMIISVSGCSAARNTSQDTAQKTAQVTSNDSQNRESIYQVALLQSLTQGYYDGIIKVSELKEHGDIGIGTFEGVNGEMIVLDGKVYQALGDGSVQEADNDETVPFSNVTFFDKDITSDISDIKNIDALKENLDKTVDENGRNMFYFIKINGTFNKMNVRSELKQKKPYKSLDKALATDQREFNYKDIKGTVVALYCPDYMDGLNTPGWHFHFVSDDRKKGGHILELAFDNAKAEMDKTSGFEMKLSDNKTFQKLELAKDVSQAIKKVETNDD
jgi:acetolactate decarboxylase